MPTLVNESAATLQYAEAGLALAEAEVSVRKAEVDLQTTQAEHSAITSHLADAQRQHAEIFKQAVAQASRGLQPENLAEYSAAQTAVTIYERIEEHFRVFRLADANVNHLSAVVAYQDAVLAAERARRTARETEIMTDLAHVRTGGAPLELDMKNLLSPHDRLILAAERDLKFAQETLTTAQNEALAAKREYLERHQ